MLDIHAVWTFLKKHFSRKDVLILTFLIVLYFATRILNLTQLPIFNDEGIYIHWAKVAWHDATWRFVSLTDGKQPLQTWGTIPLLKIFSGDALFAGRMFSVLTGFLGLAGIFTLLFYLFRKKTAYIGSLLYIFIPYFLFYDRMAMVDSGVNAFFIWIFFFSILLVKTIRLDVALIFGLVAGMGLLAKSSVRLFVGLSLFAPLLMKDIPQHLKKNASKLLSFFLLFILTGSLAFAIYNIQRLSPFLHFVEEKNKTFVMTFTEWINNPFAVFPANINIIPYYVFSELGWAIVPFSILGLIKILRKEFRLGLYLVLWIIIPYIGIAFMTRVLFPRYIIFLGTLLVVPASYFLSELKPKLLLACMGVIVGAALYFDYFMWFNYKGIIFPPTDRGQYIIGPTVGYGAREIMEYAREQSKLKPVIMLVQGDFGMAGDILDVYKRDDDRIYIKGTWPLTKENLIENQKELKYNYVYVVLAQTPEFPQDWPMKLIKSYPKSEGNAVIYFSELTQ